MDYLKNDQFTIKEKWQIPQIEKADEIITGDMPGDKVQISHNHVAKAQEIFPKILELLMPILNSQPNHKAVIGVHGGSGVGKSEIGSLLNYYLNEYGIGAYVLSGDNYPHRIPKYNDAERCRVFRTNGIKGLVASGAYTEECKAILEKLVETDHDADPQKAVKYPWLDIYQKEGMRALKEYLGTGLEIDFTHINEIIADFKNGEHTIMLRRMGREANELWYEPVSFSNKHVLIIEWTHGNNPRLEGVDLPILLNSTPQETLEHRKLRNRDGGTDSAFTSMVLGIEQGLLYSQAERAKIIVSKDGEIISYEQYLEQMKDVEF